MVKDCTAWMIFFTNIVKLLSVRMEDVLKVIKLNRAASMFLLLELGFLNRALNRKKEVRRVHKHQI